jgi:hypothetical protein
LVKGPARAREILKWITIALTLVVRHFHLCERALFSDRTPQIEKLSSLGDMAIRLLCHDLGLLAKMESVVGNTLACWALEAFHQEVGLEYTWIQFKFFVRLPVKPRSWEPIEASFVRLEFCKGKFLYSQLLKKRLLITN